MKKQINIDDAVTTVQIWLNNLIDTGKIQTRNLTLGDLESLRKQFKESTIAP